MIPTQENELFESGWKLVYIVWAAMFAAMLIYLPVGILVEETVHMKMDNNVFETLRNILYGLSVIILIASKLLKNYMLSDNGLRSKPFQRQPGQPPQDPAIGRYLMVMMYSLALSEAVAIFGLVLFFAGKNRMDLYFLISVSALAMIYYHPNKDEALSLRDTKQF